MRNAIDVARHARGVPLLAARPLIAVVFEGLSEEQKQLPSTLLFDAEGARLFERVCEQPEYPLVRAEARLLRRHAEEIATLVGTQAAVVEYGVGAGDLGACLLAALPSPHSYVPVDLEPARLARARDAARRGGQAVRVLPVCQDLREFVALPASVGGARRRIAYLPDAAVGALRPLEAVALLNSIREAMGPDGGLVVGVDLLKDPARHQRAYDDAAGAMADFNRNLLVRLNRELDATFDVGAFAHRACWHASRQRVELDLVSVRAQNPTIAGIGIALADGESVLTAFAHKYTLEGWAALARPAGWAACASWVDDEHGYALQYLTATE